MHCVVVVVVAVFFPLSDALRFCIVLLRLMLNYDRMVVSMSFCLIEVFLVAFCPILHPALLSHAKL